MFIDYAQLMAEDGQPMSMAGWLGQTDRLLEFSRCDVLPGKGKVSREAAARCVSEVCEQFRKPQDAEYISDFARAMSKYLKAGRGDGE